MNYTDELLEVIPHIKTSRDLSDSFSKCAQFRSFRLRKHGKMNFIAWYFCYSNSRAEVPSKSSNLHYPKMHISKFCNKRTRDSQKISEVKVCQNEHEWDGFPQE